MAVAGRLAGQDLPDVTLASTDGTDVALRMLPGRSVIAVYPWTGRPGQPNPPAWDDIPGAHGSTPELEGLRDRAAQFEGLGVQLFGLSLQDTAYQRELVERLKLPFPILSDVAGAFSGALALPSFATGGQRYLERLTLVVTDSSIAHVFHPVADPASHADEVLAWLEGKGASSR